MYFKSSHTHIFILASSFVLFIITGCGEQPSETETTPTYESVSQKNFYLGLIPEQDLFSQKERYRPLAEYLSNKAGINVELKILSRYGNIIQNFIDGELDGAFFGSFTGALAIKTIGVEPIARPVWLDGNSTYYGMIFTRKDSGIKDAADMKGKRFAFVDKATTAGWLLPLNYFYEIGIEDHTVWFGETYFAGTHEDTILDVLNGNADIGAAKNTVFYRIAATDKRLLDELQILVESPKVPANSLAVRHDIAPALKVKLRNILLEMDHNKEGKEVLSKFGAQKFIETTEKDYAPVFLYAEKVKLDLKRYNYWND